MKKLFSITLFLPIFAFASSGTYELLAPLGPLSGSVTLSDYLNGIMQVVIGVAGILAVVMIVKSGIELIGSPSVSKRSEVRATIGSAILGLILAMGSWVILNTINSDLLKKDITIGNVPAPLPVIVKSNDETLPMTATQRYFFRFKSSDGYIKNSPLPGYSTMAICKAEADAADKLTGISVVETPANSGERCFLSQQQADGESKARNLICGNAQCFSSTPVAIKQGPCPVTIVDCAKAGYINVTGMPQSAIDGIKALANASGQNIMITGGTESGHSTHRANAPIFDLRKTGALDTWIQKNSTQSTMSFAPYCRYRLTLGGNVFWFTNEGDHWHVCQKDQPYWYCADKDKLGKDLPEGFSAACPGGSGGGSSRSGSSGGGSAGSSGSSGGSSGSGGSLPVCATPPTGPNCVCPSTAYPNMGNDGWYCP
jgi:uncharacterized membrane protein YgcG